MTNKCSIYLAGKIKKGHENDHEAYWTEQDLMQIQNGLSPMQVNFLNPAHRMDDLTNMKSVFGRDMAQVFISDVVWVDARDRRGLGVGAEMMWAKVNQIPLIALSPDESFYRKSNAMLLDTPVEKYTHPFIEEMCDGIVASIEEGVSWIKQHMQTPKPIKGQSCMTACMQYYLEHQFSGDQPMVEMVANDECLNQKLLSILKGKG